MADSFSFVGFDGISYDYPIFPSSANEFKYYVFIKGNFASFLCCFNKSIKITSSKDFFTVELDNSEGTSKIFRKHASNNYYEVFGNGISMDFYYSSNYKIIYSSENLINYKEEFINADVLGSTIIIEPSTVSLFSVAPQVENIEMYKVLSEVTGILPILIVILVSFIGLRKSINFIFGLFLHT